jgi:hypothetical protein
MLRILSVASVAMLAGCASLPPQTSHVVTHKAPSVKTSPPVVIPEPIAPPTFKERFKSFRGKLRWTH